MNILISRSVSFVAGVISFLRTGYGMVLLAIVLLASFLRIYRLAEIPHGFYVEEMTNAYIGRYIFLHGRDIYGNTFPLLYFDKFGDFPPVLPLYLSGAATFLFGITEFAARIPVAIIGVLGVIPMYLLGKTIFGKKSYGLVAALILAVSPWHIVLSRTTAEGIVGMTAYSFALWFILDWYSSRKNSRMYMAVFLFFLCYHLYPGLRLFVPMTVAPVAFIAWRNKHRGTKLAVVAALFFLVLTGIISQTHWGKARFAQTSLLTSKTMKEQLATKNGILASVDAGNIPLARTFHNKPVAYIREFFHQYLTYFSPLYLFYEGGGQYRYYNVPDQGLIPITFLLLFAAAFIPHMRYPFYPFIIYLLVVSPLSSAITVDFTPHIHRSLFMLLPLTLVAVYGWIWLSKFKLWKFIPVLLLVIPLSLELIYFWHMYTGHSPSFQSTLRNDGDRELVQYVSANRTSYETVYMPAFERLPLYYLFYTKNFDKKLTGTFTTELRLPEADNVKFVNDWCPTKIIKREEIPANSLIIESSECRDAEGYKTNGLIHRKDGTLAYKIYVN